METESFADKKITASEILGMRDSLVEKYGKQIINGPNDTMSPEEQMASVAYTALSDSLHEIVPKIINLDRATNFFVRNDINTVFDFLIPFRMLKRKPNTNSGKIIVSLWLITQILILAYSVYGIGSLLLSFLNSSSSFLQGPLSLLGALISIPFFWLLGANSNNVIAGIILVITFFISYYVIPIIIAEIIFSIFYGVWSTEKITKQSNIKFSQNEMRDFLNNLEQSYNKSKATK